MFASTVLRLSAGCVGVFAAVVLFSSTAGAVSETVLISAVQATGPGGVSDELVELRNISSEDIDMNGWKLEYVSSSGKTTKTLYEFPEFAKVERLFLPAGAAEVFVSGDNTTAKGAIEQLLVGMNHLEGTVVLSDASGDEVDVVGWGDAFRNESQPALAMNSKQLLQRSDKDTDDNSKDFGLIDMDGLVFETGNLFEKDLIDMCTNTEELDLVVPLGMERLDDGSCRVVDACLNLPDIQLVVPDGYYLNTEGECLAEFEPADLRMRELLPNPGGVDTGNEFIELYNASDEIVELDWYWLEIDGSTSVYLFPDGASIEAGSYVYFSDEQLGVRLVNSTGKSVRLMAYGASPEDDARVVDESPSYQDAADDESWAWFEDGWLFTNRPTPGEENTMNYVEPGQGSTVVLAAYAPCGEGKYRNPLTNRCKTIETDAGLQACGPGQYRNPETNRCKSVTATTASLKPCGEGEYRNPETNRCKKIATTASALKPCEPGYERNPETNRCRKVSASGAGDVPAAAFAVEPIGSSSKTFAAWWALGGVLIGGFGYAAWEWRSDVLQWIRGIKFGKSAS